MSTNRPFLANFLAAFRAQSTYKAASQSSNGTSTLSSAQISQNARAIATKAANSAAAAASSAGPPNAHHHHASSTSASSAAATAGPANQTAGSNPSTQPHNSHHYHHSAPDSPLTASPPPTPSSSTPIPINRGPDRQRRGSDSSSGSGGFRDALGPEKWYIGGRTPAGEERFYRLGMVTKGGGRLGGGGRVGSIDQLSL